MNNNYNRALILYTSNEAIKFVTMKSSLPSDLSLVIIKVSNESKEIFNLCIK